MTDNTKSPARQPVDVATVAAILVDDETADAVKAAAAATDSTSASDASAS